jgi:hypothetical protein
VFAMVWIDDAPPASLSGGMHECWKSNARASIRQNCCAPS